MKDMCPVCDRKMPKKHMDESADKKLIKKEIGKAKKGMKREMGMVGRKRNPY